MRLIDADKLLQLMDAVEEHCDNKMRRLNPNAGGQEGYDHGTYTGVKILIKRVRAAVDSAELEPGPDRKENGDIEIIKSRDRKLYIMDGEETA